MTQTFHSRLLLVIVGLVVVAQVGTSVAMFGASRHTADLLADQQLSTADRLVQDTLAARDQEYRSSLQALAGDFAFREAVASHDVPTINSALANHGARISADLVVLLDNLGQIIASTDSALMSTPSLALAQVLSTARDVAHAPAIASYKGTLLQLVVVPVRAPTVIGWVGMGFEVRDYVADQIKAIGGVDITFTVFNAGAPSAIAASTLPQVQRAALDPQMQRLIGGGAEARVLDLQGEEYLSKAVAVTGDNGPPFFAVLQLPERRVIAPLIALRQRLLLWGGSVLVVCLIAAVLSARLLSRPIQALANVARGLGVTKPAGAFATQDTGDDVSSLAGAFQALAHRTQYDSLTGLPNRSLFAEWLSAAISRAERERTPLAVVFLDLDGFRNINDRLGRVMGDLVLRKTAQRLLRSMRTSDIVARIGADEFVLVLDGVSQAGALKIIDRLMPVIAKPMQSPNGPIRVTMRAGIAVFPDHARDRESLLNLADRARYESKTRKQPTVIARAMRDAAVPATVPDAQTGTQSMSSTRLPNSHDTWSGAPWEGDDLATQPMKKLEVVKPKP